MRDRLLAAEKVKAIDWRDDALYLLDQRVLPFEEVWHRYTTAAGVAEAIRTMVVRGAPAIGIMPPMVQCWGLAPVLPTVATGIRRWKKTCSYWPTHAPLRSTCSGR